MSYDWGAYLFASPHRREILERLSHSPADTRELTEAFPISRVTVQRHVKGFVEFGWVEKVDGVYQTTALGDHVYECTSKFLTSLSVLEENESVIESLTTVEAFDPTLLQGATVTTADKRTPHSPIAHYQRVLTECEATEMYGLTPVFSEVINQTHAQLLRDGVATELVIPTDVLSISPKSIDDVPPSLFTLYVTDETVEFGLLVTDEVVLINGYDDRTFVTCVETREPAALEWGKALFDSYRTQATELELGKAGEIRTQ